MRLGEMNNLSAEKLNQSMRVRVGWNFGDLSQLTTAQASAMLESVDSKIAQFKTTSKLHESEKSSTHNGLMLAKQVLETYLAERAESQAQATAARIALKHKRAGTKPKPGSASAEMMKMSEKDLEDFAKMKKGAPKKKTNESRTGSVFEDEVGQAESIMAAQDMVDSIQGMLEDVGEMLNEKLPPLVDSLRRSNSADSAATFNSTTSGLLSSLMDAVRSAREEMANAVGALSGQEPTPMGSDASMEPDSDSDGLDLDEPESDSGDEFEMDDFAASDAAQGGDEPLGRAKRD